MEFLKFLGLVSNKESGGETNDILTKAAAKVENNSGEKRAEDPNLQRILDNPLEALENNEKLRNAVLKKQKEFGLNIIEPNSESGQDEFSTDMSKIKLKSKFDIALNDNNGRVNFMLIGKSGSGQTSLISYLTNNDKLQGADTMFAQKFQGVTFDLIINGGNATVRVHESPGMCSGFEVPQLEEHWNNLIETVNQQGGVSLFLLLIKSNERVTAQFIDELEEFSELYFDNKEMFWKRTVVIFTAIDELTNCNTFKYRVEKIKSQVNMRGLEKLKRVIDQTEKECLYVNCFDEGDKQRIVNDLTNMIVSILPDYFVHTKEIDHLEPVVKTNENIIEVTPILASKPLHLIDNSNVAQLECEPNLRPPNQLDSDDIITVSESEKPNKFLMSEPISVYRTVDLNTSNDPDLNPLSEPEAKRKRKKKCFRFFRFCCVGSDFN